MTIEAQLVQHLEQFPSLPFLFAGSGLARRYLGTETWGELLRIYAGETPRKFEYYLSAANSKLPQVATLIAEEFHAAWWEKRKFASSRKRYLEEANHKDSPLKIEISRYLGGMGVPRNLPEPLQIELELLRKAHADGIITTNWDTLLESLFPEFRVFVGQEELVFSNPQGIAEIYKIHGSCSRPNSLVLTASDYEQFQTRNPYLAAKLLSIFVEHPVVFLGYSLSDPNIAQILDSLVACLSEQHLDKLRDRLIFVEWDSRATSPSFSPTVMQLQGKPSLPLTLIRTASFTPVFSALSKPKRRFPARVLRQLKESVYELVRENDPKGRLYVTDLDDSPADVKFDVVYGVGLIDRLGEKGYVAISADDLRLDVLYEDRSLDSIKVIEHTLWRLLIPTKYVPVFNYLRKAGYLPPDGKIPEWVDARIRKAAEATLESFQPSPQYQKKVDEVRRLGSVEAVVKEYGPGKASTLLPLLGADRIQLDELRTFLVDNERLIVEKNSQQTSMRKLVCVYDYLRHGLSAKKVRTISRTGT